MRARWWRDRGAAGTIRLAVGTDAEDPSSASDGGSDAGAGADPTDGAIVLDADPIDEAVMVLTAALVRVRLALTEAADFRRAEDLAKKGKAPAGRIRRNVRRQFLEAVDETIDRGTLAAVAHVMFGDAESEQEGIAAMARVAPMVVELQAARPKVYRLLKVE